MCDGPKSSAFENYFLQMQRPFLGEFMLLVRRAGVGRTLCEELMRSLVVVKKVRLEIRVIEMQHHLKQFTNYTTTNTLGGLEDDLPAFEPPESANCTIQLSCP